MTARDEREGRARVAMQQREGLPVRWLSAAEATAQNPTLGPDGHRGGSFIDSDGAIDPPRNVRAYALAMARAGVELRERTAFTGSAWSAVGSSASTPRPARSPPSVSC